ncbi:MAG: DUF4249 domain-containing protein [Bacteroidales bacterium]|nr:DUF4249 domain-containing protein [Bacteroidales bacterium]MCF8391250.1 DUF4249 domain-containing protein [Bacteroidales bacterium]
MKISFKYFFRIAAIILVLPSCEPELNIDIFQPDDKIVIDGWIESGRYASVLLTANAPYFSTLDSASMRDLVLSRAKVSLVHNHDTTILTLKKNEDYFPPLIYVASALKGEIGESYTLIAEYGQKRAVAHTTITPVVELDTIFSVSSDMNDSLAVVFIRFTDPPEKNYYRLFTQRKNKDTRYRAAFITALDDKYFNGSMAEISISSVNETLLSQDDSDFFVKGDTVMVKLCTMDKASFDFWSSYQEEMVNTNNPFAASLTSVKSNVEEDGLGVWSGYGVSIMEIVLE